MLIPLLPPNAQGGSIRVGFAEEGEKNASEDSGGSQSESVISLSDNEHEHVRSRTDHETGEDDAAEMSAETSKTFKPPVGVTLIGDDEELVQVGMQKAMRQPRCFSAKHGQRLPFIGDKMALSLISTVYYTCDVSRANHVWHVT